MNAIRHFLLALQFFTRIPVTGRLGAWLDYSDQRMRASAAHYPGIGLLVGLVAALVYAALAIGLRATPGSALVAALLSTVATVLLTGGFHEDGLADVADGLGGAYDRERALEIMKDSRVGAFGAMALVLALATKVALLALLGELGWPLACAALVLGHLLSRTWSLLMIRMLPHLAMAGGSKSKPLADRIEPGVLGAAAVWVALGLIAIASTGVLYAFVIALAAAGAGIAFLWMLRLFHRRLQGFTGDCLGATQQVTEIACYLTLALVMA